MGKVICVERAETIFLSVFQNQLCAGGGGGQEPQAGTLTDNVLLNY